MKKLLLASTALIAFSAAPAHAGPVFAAASAFVGWASAGLSALASNALGQIALGVGSSLLQTAFAKKTGQTAETKIERETGDANPLSFTLGRSVTGGSRKYTANSGTRLVAEVIEVSCLPQIGTPKIWVDDEEAQIDWGRPITSWDWFKDGGGYSNPNDPVVGYGVKQYREGVGGADQRERMVVKYYDGTQALADAWLVNRFSGNEYPYSEAMVGAGKSYLIVYYYYDPEVMQSPPSVTVEPPPLRLYDLRNDDTNGGSGNERWDDPTTWTGTGDHNPAIQNYNIARGIYYHGVNGAEPFREWVWGGKNLAAWRLPSQNWISAANACDVLAVNADGSTEPTYQTGLRVSVDLMPLDVMEQIGNAANMQFAPVGGALKVVVDLPSTSVLSITDENVIVTEGQTFDPFPALSETYNEVSAKYPEPSEKWATKDSPKYPADGSDRQAALRAEDGGRYSPTSIDLTPVWSATQAQRVQQVQLDKYRRWRSHQYWLSPMACGVEPIDLLDWSSNWNGYSMKNFLAGSVTLAMSLNVMVTPVEADPSDYDGTSDWVQPVQVVTPVNQVVPAQGIETFAAAPVVIQDADGTDRRPALQLSVANTETTGLTALHMQLAVDGGSVSVDQSLPINDDLIWTYDAGILSATTYRVRARLMSNLTAKSEWSDWVTVTTDDVRLSAADLDDDLTGQITAAQEGAAAAVESAQAASDAADAVRQDLNAATDGLVGTIQENLTAVNEGIAGFEQDLSDLDRQLTDLDEFTHTSLTNLSDTLFTDGGQLKSSLLVDYYTKQDIDGSINALETTVSSRFAQGANILSVGDFSQGIGDWHTATEVVDPPVSLAGTTKVLKQTDRDVWDGPYRQSGGVANRKFRYTGKVYTGKSAFAAYVGLNIYHQSGGKTYPATWVASSGEADWVSFDVVFELPATAISYLPRLASAGAWGADGHEQYWADLFFEDVTEAQAVGVNVLATVSDTYATQALQTEAIAQAKQDVTTAFKEADAEAKAEAAQTFAAKSSLTESVAQAKREVQAQFASTGASLVPNAITDDFSNYTRDRYGAPESAGASGFVYVDDADEGASIEWSGLSAGANFCHRAAIKTKAGRIYRVKAKFTIASTSSSSTLSMNFIANCMNADYSLVNSDFGSSQSFPVGEVCEYSRVFGPTALTGVDEVHAALNTAAYLRFGLRVNQSGQAATIRLHDLVVEDVTDAVTTNANISDNIYTKSDADGAMAAQISEANAEFRDPATGQIKSSTLTNYYNKADTNNAINAVEEALTASIETLEGAVEAGATSYQRKCGGGSGAVDSAGSAVTVGSTSGAFGMTYTLVVKDVAGTASDSTAYTNGARFEIPDTVAAAFAGQRIRIAILARRAMASASTYFGVAYATNDNGNSGVMKSEALASGWDWYVFYYDKPVASGGGSDWLGLFGDYNKGGLQFVVAQVVVSIAADDLPEVVEMQGDITDIKALDVDKLAGTAIGTFLTQLDVNAGGTSATIKSQGEAISDLEGNASAGYLIKAQAGGSVSLLDLIAADGSAGSVSIAKLSADDILLQGSVTADSLLIASTESLCYNGGMKSSGGSAVPYGWLRSGTAYVDFIEGNASHPLAYRARLRRDGGGQPKIYNDESGFFSVKKGDTLAVDFMAWVSPAMSSANKIVYVGLNLRDSVGNNAWTFTTVSGLNGVWSEHEALITVPDVMSSSNSNPPTSARLWVQTGYGGSDASYYVEVGNFTVRKQAGTVMIKDGSITGDKLVVDDAVITNSAQIKDLTVDTINIKDAAVTQVWSVSGSASVNNTETPYELLSLSVALDSAMVTMFYVPYISPPSSAGATSVTVTIFVDGTEVHSEQIDNGGNEERSFSKFLTLGAGNHTFSVKMLSSGFHAYLEAEMNLLGWLK